MNNNYSFNSNNQHPPSDKPVQPSYQNNQNNPQYLNPYAMMSPEQYFVAYQQYLMSLQYNARPQEQVQTRPYNNYQNNYRNNQTPNNYQNTNAYKNYVPHYQNNTNYENKQGYERPNTNFNNNKRKEYPKPKPVRIDPVLDTPEEIRKWIEARKRNYPSAARAKIKEQQSKRKQETGELTKFQISKMEQKLRKHISIMSCSTKSLEIKCKNMETIKNIITEPIKRTKQIKKLVLRKSARVQRLPRQQIKQEKLQQNNDEQIVESKIQKRNQISTEPERVQQLIQSLKAKREQQNSAVKNIFDYKSNTVNYKYMKNTLTANLLVEDIFKENCYLLQSIRYIVKTNFLENQQTEEPIPEINSSEEEDEEEDENHMESGLEEGEIDEGEIA